MPPPEVNFIYRATCVKVIDGDTLDLLVDLGFRAFEKVRVRLRGYNAPELSTQEGRWPAWPPWTSSTPSIGDPPQLTVQSYKDQHSFERWICDVWMPDGTPLGDALGLAKV
jgi:micrococcal nuclease